MFEELWLDKIHPILKEIVIEAKKCGARVTSPFNPFGNGLVMIRYGPLSVQGFDPKTGELVLTS
jgi:hypothetical protein